MEFLRTNIPQKNRFVPEATLTALLRLQHSSNLEIAAAFSPYWYIDENTDSIVEVKNNLDSTLAFILVLTPSGTDVGTLLPLQVAPGATERLSLRDMLELPNYGGRSTSRWGDGSRPGSVVGAACLIPVTDRAEAIATAFSAWVFTQDQVEGLALVTPFFSPADKITTILEGLWWLPFDDTQALFALQNTSFDSLQCTFRAFANGSVAGQKTFILAPSTAILLNLATVLGTTDPPRLGGVHITYSSTAGHTRPGQLLARGLLIQERLGFSSSLTLYEYLGTFPTSAKPDLRAPIAYFGELNALLKGATARLRPNLLLRNVAARPMTVESTVDGVDVAGVHTELRLTPLLVQPQAVVQIDLEGVRQHAQWFLRDGVASVRIRHDCAPTDLVAELINVDETGDVVWYDRFRNLFFHQAQKQAAISFNVSPGRQSFVILKNITSRPQIVRVFLHVGDNGQTYEVNMPEVQGQEVAVVDIKQLRDAGVPGRNGEVLPPHVTYGGATVFSDSGAFICSDPTFLSRPRPTQGSESVLLGPVEGGGTGSCVHDGDLGGGTPSPAPPPPHKYPRGPFAKQRGPCLIGKTCIAGIPGEGGHTGMDVWFVGMGVGEPIFALESGRVTGLESSKTEDDNEANGVIIQGDDGAFTVYAHVDPWFKLQVGDVVREGDIIGGADLSGPHNNDIVHVHISRLLAGTGTNEDVNQRLLRGEFDCNWEIPCMSRANFARAVGRWPFVGTDDVS